ncbi:MAG: hypothetical protein ACKESB_01035 [Candidatus Hodgkinia cicadicola]
MIYEEVEVFQNSWPHHIRVAAVAFHVTISNKEGFSMPVAVATFGKSFGFPNRKLSANTMKCGSLATIS